MSSDFFELVIHEGNNVYYIMKENSATDEYEKIKELSNVKFLDFERVFISNMYIYNILVDIILGGNKNIEEQEIIDGINIGKLCFKNVISGVYKISEG